MELILAIIGIAIILIGFPVYAHMQTGKWWIGPAMFLACAFILFMALR